MSGIQFHISLNDNDLSVLMSRVRQLGEFSRVLRSIGQVIHSQAMESFETESSPGGEDWIASQRAEATGGQTLSDTGALRNSIDVAVTGDEAEVGSNLIYAAIHQLGGEAGRNLAVKLPARPYLPDADTIDRGEIEDVLMRHLAEVFA